MTQTATNPWMEERLARLGPAGVVLDLGCGRGWWLSRMPGMQAIGVEPDPARAADAARRSARPVAGADARHLPLAAASVSLVWCVHVLHHLPDPSRALTEARRVLRPDGALVLAETVEDHPAIRVARRVRPEWDGVAVESRFTAARCLELVREAGFEIVDHRQHSLVSFAAWTLPTAQRRAWISLSQAEDRLARRSRVFSRALRFGAHLECEARAR